MHIYLQTHSAPRHTQHWENCTHRATEQRRTHQNDPTKAEKRAKKNIHNNNNNNNDDDDDEEDDDNSDG